MQYKELRKAIGPVLLELKFQCFSIKFTTLSLHYIFLQKNMNSSSSLNMWTSIKAIVQKTRMIDLKPLSAIPITQDFVLVIHTILPSAPNFFFF